MQANSPNLKSEEYVTELHRELNNEYGQVSYLRDMHAAQVQICDERLTTLRGLFDAKKLYQPIADRIESEGVRADARMQEALDADVTRDIPAAIATDDVTPARVTPKKRGRKPAAKRELQTSPKRRGRPRKVPAPAPHIEQAAEAAQEMGVAIRKRRGRKPAEQNGEMVVAN